MEQVTLRDFEAQCVQEEPPACQTSCPLHVEARPFIRFMAEGNMQKARQQLDRTLPLSCLTAYLCEGICQKACKRGVIDDAIQLPLLERACVLNSSPATPMPLPESGKKVAVAGTGLSSLVLAWELGKKGHAVHLFHVGTIGSDIIRFAKERLPEKAMPEAVSLLTSVRVKYVACDGFDDTWLDMCLADFDRVYLGLDDMVVAAALFNLDKKDGSYTDDLVTLVTENPHVVAGGYTRSPNQLCIQAMADGKKAAGSIDRLLQGVAPSTAREREEAYDTKLFTNLADIKPVPHTRPDDALLPQLDEAQNEALRCIQCECLECVKRCSFLAAYKAYPKKYVREIYNNLSIVHGLRQANTLINSCAQCGLCAKICPQGLNMGVFCSLARREMVEAKRMPPSAHEFALEDMFFSNSDAVRFFRHQQGHTQSKYVFFPGCQLPAVLPEQVLSAYEHLCEHVAGGVGFQLGCCGMPAMWASRDAVIKLTVSAFRQDWESAGKPTYIMACASCSDFFMNHCPDIPHISVWEILADLPVPQGARALPQRVLAIHDPCASRNVPSMQTGLRNFVESLQQPTIELELGREHTRCCGFGGLVSEANPALADTFVADRKTDTDEALLVYCAICRERMQKNEKACLHVLEIAFPSQAPEKSLEKSFLNLFERQDRRLDFKKTLLERIFGEKDTTMPYTEQDINAMTLRIDSPVATLLDERRIVRADIVAVLLEAEKHGASFLNTQTGRSLASLRPRQVTYWVEYTKEDDGTYRIFDAYCHRMIVPGVAGEGALPHFEAACCTEKHETKQEPTS